MKICVTSQGDTLQAQVDPRFGRCVYFIVVDTDTMEFEAINNAQTQVMGGAGVQSGQLMTEKDVKAVLTGNVGPNAYQTLNAGGIEIITGVSGTIQEAVDHYKKGDLKATDRPNVESHFGMKKGN
jgi:predicted Fe-Mo cluster-binding NifX family protein